MLSATIAILDDEPRMVQILTMLLERDGYEVVTYEDPRRLLKDIEAGERYDLILSDLKMPGLSGIELLTKLKPLCPHTQVIMMTAYATINTAVEAMKLGAFDYLQKPFEGATCRAAIKRALDQARLTRENHYLRAQLKAEGAHQEVAPSSPAMLKTLALAKRAARSLATVMIRGESGSGKEVLARTIHLHSDRVAGPFLALNCKALASGVLESELFGHEKGSFTGAQRTHLGFFERAQGGTLFLDEVGELDLDVQAKLLRVIQERTIQRVGGDATISIDARLVCATHQDLDQLVARGQFREDLYYRLNVIPLHIPALRERPEDLLPLARHFIARTALTMELVAPSISEELEQWMLAHTWPGNVRELENLMQRAVIMSTQDTLTTQDLLLERAFTHAPIQDELEAAMGLQEFLDHQSARKVLSTLAQAGGNRTEAAARLGIDRTTLYRLMRRLSLEGEL